ncbi:hypothetical protein LCGC14_2905010, partial [marine sediment metagenome]
MVPAIAGSTYESLVAQGVESERAMAAGLINAALQAPLEAIGVGKLFKVFAPKKLLFQRLKNYVLAVGTEGLTEFAQAFPDHFVQLFALNPDQKKLEQLAEFLDPENWKKAAGQGLKEAKTAMMFSAIVGGVGMSYQANKYKATTGTEPGKVGNSFLVDNKGKLYEGVNTDLRKLSDNYKLTVDDVRFGGTVVEGDKPYDNITHVLDPGTDALEPTDAFPPTPTRTLEEMMEEDVETGVEEGPAPLAKLAKAETKIAETKEEFVTADQAVETVAKELPEALVEKDTPWPDGTQGFTSKAKGTDFEGATFSLSGDKIIPSEIIAQMKDFAAKKKLKHISQTLCHMLC